MLLEDNRELADMLKKQFELLGYAVETFENGERGLEHAMSVRFNLHIIDVMLEGEVDGFEVCRQIRESRPESMILLLSSRADELDKVRGLNLGADDYVGKPFQLAELIARVQSLLRRGEFVDRGRISNKEILRIRDLEINLEKRRVILRGDHILLSTLHYDLLVYLASNAGKPISHDELTKNVWGYHSSQFAGTIASHVCRLRAKIEIDASEPEYIFTVHGFGYRFGEN